MTAEAAVRLPRLTARNLTCTIGRAVILRDVDLEVHPGEMLGLIGPNGSGKSTLLRVLAAIRRPSVGEVLLDGQPIEAMRPSVRARHLAFVPQEEAGASDLTVSELVGLGRVPHTRAWGGVDEGAQAAVRHALEHVDLVSAWNTPLDRLSGGERRRAVIARGLAQEAPLLLLDEPTNHLDIRHQLALLRRIRTLTRTIVVALHDIDLAATFCDRIAILHGGSLLALGPPEQVLSPRLLHDAFGVLATRVTHPLTGRTHLLFSHDEREKHP